MRSPVKAKINYPEYLDTLLWTCYNEFMYSREPSWAEIDGASPSAKSMLALDFLPAGQCRVSHVPSVTESL